MDINLLKSDIKKALNEPDEKIRVGRFWTVARSYDSIVPIFKIMIEHDTIQKIVSEECAIMKQENNFLITDSLGNQMYFTNDELRFFIDLWNKAQTI